MGFLVNECISLCLNILINKMFEFKKDWNYLVIGMKLELSNIEIFKVY